jgi:hypothetical protein
MFILREGGVHIIYQPICFVTKQRRLKKIMFGTSELHIILFTLNLHTFR